jgi:importin-9
MEQQVVQLLQNTTSAQDSTRKPAESSLIHLYSDSSFPFALLSISTNLQVAAYLRQSALLTLNRYVQATWSPLFDEDFKGTIVLNEEQKSQIRSQVLTICLGEDVGTTDERKVKNAAALITGKIASVDFPDAWPELLPALQHIIAGTTSDGQVHGALRVLSELVESSFTEDQFFAIARDLVNGLQKVALNTTRKPIVRAMAMNVFRGCFDTLEMVMEDHKVAVKGFLDEAIKGWMSFFVETLKLVIPEAPGEADETKPDGLPSLWRGTIALKLQVVKVSSQRLECVGGGLTRFVDTREGPKRVSSSSHTPRYYPLPSRMGRRLEITIRISSPLHQQRTPRPTRRFRRPSVHSGLPCVGGA